MKKLYRIYTEDTKDPIGELVGQFFEGFTLYHVTGYWHGIQEQSVVIEILTDKADSVRDLAQFLKGYLAQEAVLVVELEAKGELI